MPRDFSRIAIVNRGEAAMRFLHAAREDSLERGRPLTTIALYTEPDRRSLFVREADEAVSLGAPFVTDPADGRRKSSYLDYDRLTRALQGARAEAVWVGWGLVAEHAAFADLCRDLGIVFLGPTGDVMRKLGDKIGSKLLAEAAGVPVAPWSGGPVEDLAAARRHAAEIGYPLMVKATAGGGGRGIRRVDGERDLAEGFEAARSEGYKAFGNPTVFLERRVRGGRHVEVQVVGDEQGTVWALGVRDCSVQRRHQKLIEETPSPALTADEDRFLRDAAARLAKSAGYTGAGTVEFLFEPASRQFSFLEVNARLQVEHPVTELVTGVDLVKLQLHVGRGLPLPSPEPPPATGHAVEARLNAEDPDRDFAPSPGRLEVFRPARGPGIRVDSGVEEGDVIPSEFDSMIAKLIAWGRTREEALARLSRALGETAVVIRGGASNKAFLQELLRRPEMASGDFDTEWVDRLGAAGARPVGRAGAVALAAAAVEAYEAALDVERTRFWSTAARGRPEVGEEGGRRVELRFRGRAYGFRVDRVAATRYRLRCEDGGAGGGGTVVALEVERLSASERRLTVAGRTHRVFTVLQGVDQIVEVDGVPHRVSHGDAGVVRSPAPAVVVSLAVGEGDTVTAGQRLAVIEAMKMETAIVAELSGRVAKVLVRPNVQVAPGAPLLVLEAAEGGGAAEGEAVSFAPIAVPPPADDDRGLCLDNLRRLAQLYLGWDAEPTEPAQIIARHGILCAGVDATDPELRRAEDALVAAFVDVAALFGRRPDDEEVAEGRRTSEHYLFTYLRDLGGRGKGLPARFLDRLRRALAHYGIDDLAPSPELREALFRLSLAHRGLAARQAPVLAVLDRRLSAAASLRETSDGFPELLRRLVEVSRDRFAPVHDLAREVLYRFVDEPFLDAVRRRNLAAAEEDLDRLLGGARGDERDRRLASLLGCPQPLQALVARRFADAGDEGRRLMLEVLLRRAYGLEAGHEVETRRFRGHAFAAATHDAGEGPVHLVASHARWQDFPRVTELAVKRVKKAPRKERVIADFFLHRDDAPADREAVAAEARALLVEADLPKRLERATVVVTSAPGGAGRVDFFTFRPDGDGWQEDRLLRGLHPATAERLQLWRLSGFELERLPAVDDVYAFRGRARDNPHDERLFVAGEVRDLTPQPGGDGQPVRFPHLERVYHEALAVVRRVQSRLPPERRLHWNRVTLYVRPPLDLPPSTLRSVVRRLTPAAEGLGLQKAVVFGRLVRGDGPPRPTVLEVSQPTGRGTELRFRAPGREPLETLSPYKSQVVRLRRRGLVPPYELVRLLAPPADASEGELPPGEFVEHDLDDSGERAVPVERPPGGNRANLVFGVVRNFTDAYPQGVARVLVASDPGRDMGALAEPECRRLLAALDLAQEMRVPLEWFATSAGAKIAMDSGTENMDWIARVLRRIVRFTEAGGEINLVVPGVNVGAQPYWNAEATMLMHTRGVLIMTADGAMVLTGKQALDYSGGVSAEDNQGIGGYERIMGPNGQAQYAARDLAHACRILMAYYERTWVAPGERFPRRRPTVDPLDRSVCAFPHGGDFALVGEVFSDDTNPGRKKPFDVRRVMAAVADQDRPPLERWYGMADAEVAVVWDAFLGGWPVSIVGFESRPVPRLGFHPADGPDQWTAGTLFPLSSKKVARALNAASGRRPIVFLANLSGFDGSPESMRKLQLEYGAEIGRAVVNFDGPIVFCVISRYHGGAFVVFSNALNDNFQTAALAGSYASVIGGAPAAAVVFAREVDQRAKADPRVAALAEEAAAAEGPAAARLKNRLEQVLAEVKSEKLGEVAAEFDRVHDVERARRVGSVDAIVEPARLRPWLIEAVERGMARAAKAVVADTARRKGR